MAESKQQQENYDDALIHFTNAKRGQCDVQDLFTIMMKLPAVSYTHLTLPTNREV